MKYFMPNTKAKQKTPIKKEKSIMYCLKNSASECDGCRECSEKIVCTECGVTDFIDYYCGEPYCIVCAKAKFEKEK